MDADKKRVCPVEMSGSLDNIVRRWLQNPKKILGPYVKAGMTVLDYGCGPGFFTVELARMVGRSGRVIAADLQDGMLLKLKRKTHGSRFEERITLHRCDETQIGLSEKIDFALAFYVLHEVPDQNAFFRELVAILRPGGNVLVVEPPLHVSRSDFQKTVRQAQAAGLTPEQGPKVIVSKSICFSKR